MSKLSKAAKKAVPFVSPIAAILGNKGSGTAPEDMSGKEAQVGAAIRELRDAAPKDKERILQEVEAQRKLGLGYANENATRRQSMLSDLSNLLVTQQGRQLNDRIPELAEQANLQGIFRSTGLGNSIGREAKNLSAQTSEELAKQGILNSEANLSDVGKVNNDYLQGRYSGMSREFSLEDMARQGLIAKTTGQLTQPAPVKTPSAKGSGALQGGLGGAAAGATAGGVPGAIGGSVIGAIGGGQLGSK